MRPAETENGTEAGKGRPGAHRDAATNPKPEEFFFS